MLIKNLTVDNSPSVTLINITLYRGLEPLSPSFLIGKNNSVETQNGFSFSTNFSIVLTLEKSNFQFVLL
jgi:hypothetical protein